MKKHIYLIITIFFLATGSSFAQKIGGGSDPVLTYMVDCDNAQIMVMSGEPALGKEWYWQGKNSSGTSTGYPYTSQYLATSNGTYYLRERSGTTWTSKIWSIVVSLPPSLDPGAIGSNQSIFTNETPAKLTNSTSPSGGGGAGSYSFQWQQSTSGTTGWTSISGATGSEYTFTSGLSSTMYYRRLVRSNSCAWKWGNTVTVSVQDVNIPNAIGVSRCGSGEVTLTASGAPQGGTYKWFSTSSSTTVLKTGSVYKPIVTATRYYYVAAISAAGSISPRKQVQVIVSNPTYTPEVISDNQLCVSGNATFSVLLSSGDPTTGYEWYDNNNVYKGSGQNITIQNVTQTTQYYVIWRDQYGCPGPQRNTTAYVYPALTAGSLSSPQDICQNTTPSRITNAQSPTGGNGSYSYQWQMSTTGTSGWSNISGATQLYYDFPAALSSDMYYRRRVASVSTCGVKYTNAVKIDVQDPLPAPAAANQERCGTGKVNLTASGTGAASYRWYSAASGGTLLASTAGFETPVLSSNTSYWVCSVSSLGCEGVRKQVTAYINPLPTHAPEFYSNPGRCGPGSITLFISNTGPTDGTYMWYDENNTYKGSGESITVDNITQTTGYYAFWSNLHGCPGPQSSLTVNIYPVLTAGSLSSAQQTCADGIPSRITNAQSPTGGNGSYSYQWQESITGTGGWRNISGATLPYYDFPTALSSDRYYRRRVTSVSSCGSAYTSAVKIDVQDPLPAPAAANQERCGDGKVNFTASGTGAASYRWYSAATGGTLLASTAGFETPVLSSQTSYWVCSVSSLGCEGVREQVTAFVNPMPGHLPRIASNSGRCGPGDITLNLITDPNDPTDGDYYWFDSPTGNHVIAEGTSMPTGYLNTSKNYYVAWQNLYGCQGDRVMYTATVKETPVFTEVKDDHSYTAGQPVTIGATIASGDLYNWYDTRESVTPVHSGSTYSFILNESKTYYVEARDTQGCWTETRVPVQATLYAGRNYVQAYHVKVPGISEVGQVSSLDAMDVNSTLKFADGFNRLTQTISKHGSPQQHNIIQPVVYDEAGRVVKQYLPYVSSTPEVDYHHNAVIEDNYTASEQYQFYQQTGGGIATDTRPYSEVVYDGSPANRIIESAAPGAMWDLATGRTIKNRYIIANGTEAVRKWEANGTSTTAYGAGKLTIWQIIDEHNETTETYTDHRGRMVLKREPLKEVVNGQYVEWLETYYIYDDLGQVLYIIPPKAVGAMKQSGSWAVANTSDLIYTFVYDELGRAIERKVPGKGVEYLVYDELNRPILTQNALLREKNQWFFSKYDRWHRPIVQGIYTDSTYTTRTAMQQQVGNLDYNGNDYYYETFTTNSSTGYTNQAFPASNTEILGANYYDNYRFLDIIGWDAEANDFTAVAENGFDGQPHDLLRGMATGGKTKIMDGSDRWLNSVVYYNDKLRPVQTHSENHFGFTDRGTVAYDFSGKAITTLENHRSSATEILTKRLDYNYDHAGRVLNVNHTINNEGPVPLASYGYNELGQLIEKNIHDRGAEGFLQSVDFRYNIRGWLASINNSQLATADNNDDNGKPADLFGMELAYENQVTGLANQSQYNGNISAITWNNGSEQQAYAYSYDVQNRLTSAGYRAGSNFAQTGDFNEDNIGYDLNGNIAHLDRYQAGAAARTKIDELVYDYGTSHTNQLLKVNDGTGHQTGYNEASANDYTYDANGNLVSDNNKGIDRIVYNVFDKPDSIIFDDGAILRYIYNASGAQLSKELYEDEVLQKKTDYIGGMVYENDILQFIAHPEGRIVYGTGGGFEYQYAHTDHLGNVRMLYTSKAKMTTFTATMERDSTLQEDDGLFLNMIDRQMDDHATSHSDVQRILPQTVKGAGISLPVYPGDTVEMSVQGFYRGGNGNPSINLDALVTAVAGIFGGTAGGSATEQATYDLFDNNITSLNNADTEFFDSNEDVAAYLNYIIFDKNFVESRSGFIPMDGDAYEIPMLISNSIVSPVEGFIYIYLTNESNAEAYFDDFTVTIKESMVVQNTDYYPFGLQHSTSWTRPTDLKNNFLYNAGSELNEKTKNYETFYRHYDPAIGRFNGVDIMATSHHSESPYSFAGNDPVYYNDPMGDTYMPFLPPGYQYRHERAPTSFYYSSGFEGSGSGGRGGAKWGMPGSGHWSDGIGRADWSLNNGSESYQLESNYINTYGGHELNGRFFDMNGEEVKSESGGIYIKHFTGEVSDEFTGKDGKQYFYKFYEKVFVSLKGGTDPDPWHDVSSWKLAAWSIGIDIDIILGFGADESPIAYGTVLSGKDKGKGFLLSDAGLPGFGLDVSGSLEGTVYFYTGNINNFTVNTLRGPRFEANLGISIGVDAGVGFAVSDPDQFGGRVIAVKLFGGVGIPTMVGGNINWGETFIQKIFK